MNIGLTEKTRIASADILQKVLANQHILYQKMRNFHWNVKGAQFLELHTLFQVMHLDLAEDIDIIAERIRSLNKKPNGTFAEIIELADLTESSKTYATSQEMLTELLADTEKISANLRTSAKKCGEGPDSGNEDILIGQMQKQEKNAWMLRSLLA